MKTEDVHACARVTVNRLAQEDHLMSLIDHDPCYIIHACCYFINYATVTH